MKKYIIICKWWLKFCISESWAGLPSIRHMIEVTVFYSFLMRIHKPSIHHRDPEMIVFRIMMIKWRKVLTGHIFIDKYRSCKWYTIYICDIDSKIVHTKRKFFLKPLDKLLFIWIRNYCLLINIEKQSAILRLYNMKFSWFDETMDLPSMSTRRRWPLIPVIRTVKERKWTPRAMEKTFCHKYRESYPAFWFFDHSSWTPEYYPMSYAIVRE